MSLSLNVKFMFFACLALAAIGSHCGAEANDSDLPPPPVKPGKFMTKQQYKDYLVNEF